MIPCVGFATILVGVRSIIFNIYIEISRQNLFEKFQKSIGKKKTPVTLVKTPSGNLIVFKSCYLEVKLDHNWSGVVWALTLK